MAENTGQSLELKQAIRLIMNGLAITCLALLSLADMRRLAIKPAINTQYRTVCTTRDKETHELLFGRDLFQRLKDIKLPKMVRALGTFRLAGKVSVSATKPKLYFREERGQQFVPAEVPATFQEAGPENIRSQTKTADTNEHIAGRAVEYIKRHWATFLTEARERDCRTLQ